MFGFLKVMIPVVSVWGQEDVHFLLQPMNVMRMFKRVQ